MNALVQVTHTPRGLLELWLASQLPSTRRAYRVSFGDYARVVGAELGTAAEHLLGLGRGAANALALAYKAILQGEKKAPSTINLRLSALRSFVDHARRLEVVDWALEVDGLPSTPYRDTRGPGQAGFRRMLEAAAKGSAPARDVAVLWSLYSLALRRGEVASLDLEDVDLAAGVVRVAGKGDAGERRPLTLPDQLAGALAAWIAVRGDKPGALFLNRSRAHRPARLSTDGIEDIVAKHGKTAGLRVRPHGLRHTAITEALGLTRGDIRAVQQFSRHADVRTIQRYDDGRRDLGGKVAALVAGAAALDTNKAKS